MKNMFFFCFVYVIVMGFPIPGFGVFSPFSVKRFLSSFLGLSLFLSLFLSFFVTFFPFSFFSFFLPFHQVIVCFRTSMTRIFLLRLHHCIYGVFTASVHCTRESNAPKRLFVQIFGLEIEIDSSF